MAATQAVSRKANGGWVSGKRGKSSRVHLGAREYEAARGGMGIASAITATLLRRRILQLRPTHERTPAVFPTSAFLLLRRPMPLGLQ
jgi:hypothetical protein